MCRQLYRGLCLLAGVLASGVAFADWGYNMPRGVTPVSRSIYNLHMTIFWVCVAIAVAVFSVLIYALIRHRKSVGAEPAQFHEHTSLEVFWAIVPFVILVAMAIPATKVLITMDDTDRADVTIKVTGYQWKWHYEYLDENISFFSNLATPYSQIQNEERKEKWYLLHVDKPLVLPVNKKIRFLVTGNDVIHSWWVPELGIKRDAIPGFVHESWARIDRPGTYRGQCAELCGINHAYMPIVVKAVSQEDFQQWVKEQRGEAEPLPTAKPEPKVDLADKSKEDLLKLGKATYLKICAACHKPDGTGMPPVFPALKADSIAVGKPISRHINIVLHGISGTAMQAFAGQLSDAEIAAVVTYERNAWGNNTGDLVQAKTVQELRQKKS